jgi:hypothetical protein
VEAAAEAADQKAAAVEAAVEAAAEADQKVAAAEGRKNKQYARTLYS